MDLNRRAESTPTPKAPNVRAAATLGDLFPADETLARFVLAMSIARNDVRHTLHLAHEVPKESADFGYLVRVLTAHLHESLHALERWRQDTEIAQYLRKLPAPGPKALRKVNGATQRIGKVALDHARNNTFHYPHPDRARTPDSAEMLGIVMEGLATLDVTVNYDADREDLRLSFADSVAIGLTYLRHSHHDPDAVARQLGDERETAAAFCGLVDVLFQTYLMERGGSIARG